LADVPAVHQFVPTFEPGAVGGHIVELQRLCHDLGWQSDVFTEHRRYPGREAREYKSYAKSARPADVLMYHMATGSGVADFVGARHEKLVLDHHNITPASYFEVWEPAVVHGIAWGRRQLAALASRAALGLADSSFNRDELDELDYRRTAVAPILFDPAELERDVDPLAVDRLSVDGTVWLFVSRVAPNKCHHDLVKAFAVYRRVYEPTAVLRLVGPSASATYVDALRQLVTALGLDGAVEITGAVDGPILGAHYRAADVYVSVSEHEGFSVTPLEAMHHGVPVVAFGGGAVPETLGRAGLCLDAKDAGTIAAAVHRVASDPGLRAGLVAAGHARVAELSLEASRQIMTDLLRPLVEGSDVRASGAGSRR
jgi:glycosyltransferase involved in cell wall biosynthesis